MTSPNTLPDDHDSLFEEGLKLVDDALSIFMELDSDHAKSVSNILHGALTLGEIAYNVMKK